MDEAGNKKQRHYIVAPTGLFAIFTIENNDVETTNYILKDHIGSINYILNDEGNVVQELNFDAWGRRRNPTTWQYYDANATLPIPLFERGYTLHEHLDAFKLINMNGRMYDPVVARFLSADPVIQSPENSQSYNSYSYVLNNPLRFIDPSGFVAIGDSTGDGNNTFGNTVKMVMDAFNIVNPNGGDEGASSFNTDNMQTGKSKIPIGDVNPDLLETGRSKLNKKTGGNIQQGQAGGGDVSIGSAYWHYKFGEGNYNVNISKLNLSMITANDFPRGVGSERTIDLFAKSRLSTAGIVFGSIRFTYIGNDQVKVVNNFPSDAGPLAGQPYYDTYNYNVRWDEGFTFRNIATGVGWVGVNMPWHPLLFNTYGGKSYRFYFNGTGTIGGGN